MRRREFVTVATGALAAAALPGCAAFVATPVTPVNGEVRLMVRDYPQLQGPGGYLKLRPAGSQNTLYVLATEETFAVLSPVCTHLQCTVNIEGAGLRCPCHGSTFDRQGAVLLGPATQPLRRIPATLSPNGELVIQLGEAAA